MPIRVLAIVAVAFGITLGCGRTEPLRNLEDGGFVDVTDDDAGLLAPDAGPPPVVGCMTGHIPLRKATPTVMFVLDRSGSMNNRLGQGTRWQALTSALGAALPSIASEMEVGALFYPAVGADRSCSLEKAVTIVPALHRVEVVHAQMLSTAPAGQTPTAEAVRKAGALLSSVRAATSARALVLATDGAPNCNAALSPRTCVCANPTGAVCRNAQNCLDDTRTVSTVTSLKEAGLPTYVIGIQDGNDPLFIATLNAIAIAGGRARPDRTQAYYAATSEAEIEAALVVIRNQVGGCVFLTTSVPDTKGSIAVVVNDQVIEPADGGVNGWVWGNQANGEIAIIGSACVAVAQLINPTVEAQVICAPDAGR